MHAVQWQIFNTGHQKPKNTKTYKQKKEVTVCQTQTTTATSHSKNKTNKTLSAQRQKDLTVYGNAWYLKPFCLSADDMDSGTNRTCVLAKTQAQLMKILS